MSDIVRRVASREAYRSRWMAVSEDDVVFADGSTGVYGVLSRADFAVIVPRDGDRLHLVEQYRYPVEGRYWEFPQGSAGQATEMGEMAEVARRELAEETGLAAGRITALGWTHVAYGYSRQRCHVFLAEDLAEGAPNREASEADMRQRWIDAADLPRMVAAGEITDAATLAAWTLLALHDGASGTGSARH